MQELRQDPVTGRWVVIAPLRSARPKEFIKEEVEDFEIDELNCSFCPGNEHMTPPEIYSVRPPDTESDKQGWQIRIVPNKFPAFVENPVPLRAPSPFVRRPALGYHEVIIHSPDHRKELSSMPLDHIIKLIEVYKMRFLQISGDSNIKYVHLMVNHGRDSGASLEHPHSQIFGLPLIPEVIQDELGGSLWFNQSRKKCVFCWMLDEEAKSKERVLFENEGFLSFAPFASRFPFEIWVVPKRHTPSFSAIQTVEIEGLARMLSGVLSAFNEKLGRPSYNFFIHSSPCDGGDYPYFHWHAEVFPRVSMISAFELGTGIMINPTAPEKAVEIFKK